MIGAVETSVRLLVFKMYFSKHQDRRYRKDLVKARALEVEAVVRTMSMGRRLAPLLLRPQAYHKINYLHVKIFSQVDRMEPCLLNNLKTTPFMVEALGGLDRKMVRGTETDEVADTEVIPRVRTDPLAFPLGLERTKCHKEERVLGIVQEGSKAPQIETCVAPDR